jgi:hypothetical protein
MICDWLYESWVHACSCNVFFLILVLSGQIKVTVYTHVLTYSNIIKVLFCLQKLLSISFNKERIKKIIDSIVHEYVELSSFLFTFWTRDIKIFWNPVVPYHNICSSANRNAQLQGIFPNNNNLRATDDRYWSNTTLWVPYTEDKVIFGFNW